MQQRFIRYTGDVRETLEGLGATWKLMAERPAELVLDAGYRSIAEIPIVERAAELGGLWIPRG